MTDFTMLVALFLVSAISFAAPAIYLTVTMVRSGWRISLLGLLTLALTYAALRWLLLTPLFIGSLSSTEDLTGGLIKVALLSLATGALCGVFKLPAVLLNRKKPIPYENAAAISKIVSSGLAVSFGGIYLLSLFFLRLGAIFDIGSSAEKLAAFPERARLFYAMTGGDELTILLFGIIVLVPAAAASVDVIVAIYGLRAKKYWYPLFSALICALCVVPAFALSFLGLAAPALYLLIVMFVALRINLFFREQYYMFDMIARIDEKKRTNRPTSIY